jgi:hypothetical protein
MKTPFIVPIVLSLLFSTNAVTSEKDIAEICGSVERAKCKNIIDKVFASINKTLADETSPEQQLLSRSNSATDSNYDGMRFLKEGLKLTSSIGYTNSSGATNDSATGSIDTKIQDSTAGEIKFGYFGKELKDFWKLLRNDPGYSFDGNSWFQNAILENLEIDAYVGYGHSIVDPDGNNNFKVKTEEKYYIGLKYEVAFDEM